MALLLFDVIASTATLYCVESYMYVGEPFICVTMYIRTTIQPYTGLAKSCHKMTIIDLDDSVKVNNRPS